MKKQPSKTENSKKSARITSGRKTKYVPAMRATAAEVMLETGRHEDVYKAIGITAATYYRWLKAKPEFAEAIEQAREERVKFSKRKFSEELKSAFIGLNMLLTGYKEELKDIETTEIHDRETGKVLEVVSVKKRKRTIHVRPDMRAIEKVLGPNDIRHNIYLKALEEHVLNHKDDLYKLVFGKMGVGEEVEEFRGIHVLQVQVDLLKIRYMEAHVQGEYDRGNLTIDQYMEYTQRLRRDYGMISDKLEQRAQKLLGGASYSEILNQIQEFWKSLIEVIVTCLGQPYMLEDGQEFVIPVEVQGQIREKFENTILDRMDKSANLIKALPRP